MENVLIAGIIFFIIFGKISCFILDAIATFIDYISNDKFTKTTTKILSVIVYLSVAFIGFVIITFNNYSLTKPSKKQLYNVDILPPTFDQIENIDVYWKSIINKNTDKIKKCMINIQNNLDNILNEYVNSDKRNKLKTTVNFHLVSNYRLNINQNIEKINKYIDIIKSIDEYNHENKLCNLDNILHKNYNELNDKIKLIFEHINKLYFYLYNNYWSWKRYKYYATKSTLYKDLNGIQDKINHVLNDK